MVVAERQMITDLSQRHEPIHRLGPPPLFSDNQDEKAHVARLGREGVARASQARGAGPTARGEIAAITG